ncbi:MAG: hypothetical protein EXS08_02375 [Planctomycetes bacterium]|nr:hypothetical protein [Planctomycetota bacterium]
MRRIVGSWILLALLAGGAAGQLVDFEARRAEAQKTLTAGLEGYVAWCQANNLFNERKKAFEFLLELDPAHAEARRQLGFTHLKDGTWKAPEKPKTFRDFDQKALAEAPQRWREASSGYVGALLALLQTKGLSSEQREPVAREVLRFEPDNETVHALLGDVRGESGWVLPETLAAKQQREALRAQIKAAFEGASAAAPAKLNERESRIPLALKAFTAPGVRIVGTAGEEELQLAAQAVQALQRLLQSVFHSQHALPKDTTVFLLADPKHKDAFLAHHPGVPPGEVARYAFMEGSGIQGTNDFAFWTGDSQRRIDGSVRLLLGYWLSGAFQISVDQGWAYEGFGLYLTRALVRTRMTWLAAPAAGANPQTDMALRQKLMEPDTNWMDEAFRLYEEQRAPALVELFKKNAGALTTEDVLLSYALATYLLEAHAAIVPPLLTRLGAGYVPASALQEALDLDLGAFERRFHRWLSERK